MLETASICVLLGVVLAARFKVAAVIAAVPVVLIVVSTAGAKQHDGLWVAIAMIVAAVSVQLGYLGGGLIWLTISERGTNPAALSADRPSGGNSVS